MKEKEYCPTCNAEIKGGLRPNKFLGKSEVDAINYFLKLNNPAYCNSCGNGKLSQAKTIKKEKIKTNLAFIEKNIPLIPVITLQNPFGWDYSSIKAATAQRVMGTGVFSELSSSWTDFFGRPSSAYAQKIKEGEIKCFDDIRIECLRKGGNAVIGVDIDYSDLGSTKNLIMICVSGTIIKINNLLDVVKDGNIIHEIADKYEEVGSLRSINI